VDIKNRIEGDDGMDQLLPPDLRQALWSGILTFLLAWIGRMTYHIRQVQKRQRSFWSAHLLWEVPTALAIGFIADGVADYFALHGKAAIAVIIMVSYLGPAGIEAIILRLVDRYGVAEK